MPDYLDALTPEDFELDPEAARLPELTADDLPESNPNDPADDDDFMQDDLLAPEPEGMGARPDEPVSRRAVARVIAKIAGGHSNEVGYCLREIREVNEVASRYLSAKECLWAIDPDQRHAVQSWEKVPRGSIVYFDSASSRYGHITESLGGGYVGSTDWPRGRWGRVHGGTMESAWGYTAAYWSPVVNDVRVWWPKRKPKPAPKPEPEPTYAGMHAVVQRLVAMRKRHLEHDRRKAARACTRAIAELRGVWAD